jgi:hypothetical protein
LKSIAIIFLCFNILARTPSVHAQIGGAVSWNKETEQNDSSTSAKEMLVTGLGQSPEAAEKQALTAAVRQAVGAYLDSNTLVENEAVIRDRILSFSNGFVEKYKATAPARKNSDGLYEVTILATVKTSQVIETLQSNNLISAKIAGQNLWAEAAIKVQNAQDSLAFLNEKLPEQLKALIKLEFLDKNGNPTKSIEPAVQIQNAEEITATWYVRLSVDQKTYFKSFAPVLVKCLQNITGAKGEKFQLNNPKRTNLKDFWLPALDGYSGKDIPFRVPVSVFKDTLSSKPGKHILSEKTMLVVEKSTANFDYFEGTLFKKGDYHSILSTASGSPWAISIALSNSSGELLAKGTSTIHEPFSLKDDEYNNGFNRDSQHPKGAFCQVGPSIFCQTYGYDVVCVNPVYPVKIQIPLEAMKDVKNIECKIDMPAEFQFTIKPALEN